jgi:hypothetical protein
MGRKPEPLSRQRSSSGSNASKQWHRCGVALDFLLIWRSLEVRFMLRSLMKEKRTSPAHLLCEAQSAHAEHRPTVKRSSSTWRDGREPLATYPRWQEARESAPA